MDRIHAEPTQQQPSESAILWRRKVVANGRTKGVAHVKGRRAAVLAGIEFGRWRLKINDALVRDNIKGLRECIGRHGLQSMREAMRVLELQRVVIRSAIVADDTDAGEIRP
jgi:subtilisin-like proprotein convertase family protein